MGVYTTAVDARKTRTISPALAGSYAVMKIIEMCLPELNAVYSPSIFNEYIIENNAQTIH